MNFANCINKGEIKNRSRILATINPAIKTYIGITYYDRLVKDINKRLGLDEYADAVFLDEIFS